MYDDDNTENTFVNVDKHRLSQVVSNLLNNAIKFTTTKGIIKIIIEKKYDDKEEEKVYIHIKDTGSDGIYSSIIPHLSQNSLLNQKEEQGWDCIYLKI